MNNYITTEHLRDEMFQLPKTSSMEMFYLPKMLSHSMRMSSTIWFW